MGFLKQVHTSGGRVPTTKGYRFFVNEIIQNTTLTVNELTSVKDELFTRTNNLSEIVTALADAITQSTNYPAVVILDGFENLLVDSIRVLLLISGQVLVLIETNAGVITNTLSANPSITAQDCDNASKVFTDMFVGKSIGHLMKNIGDVSSKVRSTMKNYEEIFKLVLYVLENYATNKNNVTSGGVIKLLDSPEYSTVDKAKEILGILDDKQQLKDIFDTSYDDGLSIKIGEENENKALSKYSVIKTPVMLGGNKIASIGIIGPKRIDYANIASALKLIADRINSTKRKN
jgi:heat-inducible transcriptional repressor